MFISFCINIGSVFCIIRYAFHLVQTPHFDRFLTTTFFAITLKLIPIKYQIRVFGLALTSAGVSMALVHLSHQSQPQ